MCCIGSYSRCDGIKVRLQFLEQIELLGRNTELATRKAGDVAAGTTPWRRNLLRGDRRPAQTRWVCLRWRAASPAKPGKRRQRLQQVPSAPIPPRRERFQRILRLRPSIQPSTASPPLIASTKWIGSRLIEMRQVGSIMGRARDRRDNTVQTAHRSGNAKSRKNGTIRCGEPRRSLRGIHEEGSDEQTRFHQSEHSGTCSRHDSCRWQREGSGKHRE